MKINGGSNCISATASLTQSQTFSYNGDQFDFQMTFGGSIRSKTPTTIISGTDYGLENTTSGEWRYSADSEVYLVYVNVLSGQSSHFSLGMNTIVLPRSVALLSQLNYTTTHLGSMNSSDLLYQAGLSYTDPAQATSSGHIIVMIRVNLTATNADTLLFKLTHDMNGKMIGKNTTIISNDAICRLHLPSDVLCNIMLSDPQNSGLGDRPTTLTIEVFVNLVYNTVVGVVNFIASLPGTLVDLGMKVFSAISSAIWQTVNAAVTAVVDAFNAFVAWATEFMTNMVNTLLMPILDPILELVDSNCNRLSRAAAIGESELIATGSVSSGTLSKIADAILGDLFQVLLIASVTVGVILLAFYCMTMGMGFLISTGISVIAMIIIEAIVANVIPINIDIGQLSSTLYSSFVSAAQSMGYSVDTATYMVCNAVSFCTGMISTMISIIGGWAEFAWALLGTIIGAWSWANRDKLTGQIAMAMGISSFINEIWDPIKAILLKLPIEAIDKSLFALQVTLDFTSIATGSMAGDD